MSKLMFIKNIIYLHTSIKLTWITYLKRMQGAAIIINVYIKTIDQKGLRKAVIRCEDGVSKRDKLYSVVYLNNYNKRSKSATRKAFLEKFKVLISKAVVLTEKGEGILTRRLAQR